MPSQSPGANFLGDVAGSQQIHGHVPTCPEPPKASTNNINLGAKDPAPHGGVQPRV